MSSSEPEISNRENSGNEARGEHSGDVSLVVSAPFVDGTDALSSARGFSALAMHHGHVLVRGLLPVEDVEPVRALAFRVLHEQGLLRTPHASRMNPEGRLEGTGYDDPGWLDLQQKMCQAPQVLKLAAHPALIEVFTLLFGEPPQPHRGTICRLGLPHTAGLTTPLHQDHYYVGGELCLWTAWTPLVPCPLSLGPVVVADQSHHLGFRQHVGAGAGRQHVPMSSALSLCSGDVQIGDVVLFHCLTVHGALPNMSSSTLRVSMDVRFQPLSQSIHTRRSDGTDVNG